MKPEPAPNPSASPSGSLHAPSAGTQKPYSTIGLPVLFGLLYFIQGATEPTDGLTAQPVMSLLKQAGHNTAQIAAFNAVMWLPWAIKPLYGIISDFIPFAGYHRKSYLATASGVTALSLVALYLFELHSSVVMLLVLLGAATVGVAFCDVVVDALMVEKGQPSGLTGRFQAIGWASLYAATIFSGSLGGRLSEISRQDLGFLICALLAFCSLALSVFAVSDQRVVAGRGDFKETLGVWRTAARSRTMILIGLFLFCLNFNPFSTVALYTYMTQELGLSEQFYGNMLSIEATGALIGSLLYGTYCRRVPMKTLVHVSIALGLLATLAYWGLRGEMSANVIAFVSGFSIATATVIQLDLAARLCPPRTAGTMFALMMALANLGTLVSRWLGGMWYENWLAALGSPRAFNLLVAAGGAFTAACWLIVPWLRPALDHATNGQSQ